MKLVVTIDVEEEGLFQDRYEPKAVSVDNVRHLARLDGVVRHWGIRPTLLVTHAVASHRPHHEVLLNLRDRWGAEIGAHLHHWNTPPLESLPHPDPVPSELIPTRLLQEKMESLFRALGDMGVEPSSFRMGRFNIGPRMLSVLEGTRIQVDSSICPTRKYYGGPDHLFAPEDPYFPDPADLRRAGSSRILEVPLTVLPLTRRLGRFLGRMDGRSLFPDAWIAWFSKNLGSFPAQPVWTGLNRLKIAAMIHRSRGGQVLTIFFHSSEIMAGGSPYHRTEEEVDRFLKRLDSFFAWLRQELSVESLTLSELGRLYPNGAERSPALEEARAARHRRAV